MDLDLSSFVDGDFNCIMEPQEKRGVGHSRIALELGNSGYLVVEMIWWTLIFWTLNLPGIIISRAVPKSGSILIMPLL